MAEKPSTPPYSIALILFAIALAVAGYVSHRQCESLKARGFAESGCI